MAAGTQIGNVLFTDIGGVASRMLAEEALNAGEIVSVGTVDNKVVKTPASGKIPIGVVFESALINADVWVVTSGIAGILPEAGITAVRGQVAFTSASTAGRAAQSATDASRKVGTWLANGTGNGVITKAALQLVGVDAASLGGGGVTAFTWSTSEQTWPFEKDSSGNTLYAMQIDIANMPNATTATIAHGITALDVTKVFKLYGMFSKSGANANPMPLPHPAVPANGVLVVADATNIYIQDAYNWSDHSGFVHIIYAK